mgnify:CR=1 FL=1
MNFLAVGLPPGHMTEPKSSINNSRYNRLYKLGCKISRLLALLLGAIQSPKVELNDNARSLDP